MSDCFWSFTGICQNPCLCEHYLSVNEEPGGNLLKRYEEDVEEALEPVREVWRKKLLNQKKEWL